MADRGGLQTPFSEASCPTPGGEGAGGGTRGGFDMGVGSAKETPNMSGLPTQQTTVDVGAGSAPGSQVPMPPVDSPGTSHPGKG